LGRILTLTTITKTQGIIPCVYTPSELELWLCDDTNAAIDGGDFISSTNVSMNFNVGSLWGIYIAVVVVAYLMFYCCMGPVKRSFRTVGHGCAFFMATFLGAIAVFVGAAWLNANTMTQMEKTWLSVLYLVAFLLPIVVTFYVVCKGEYLSLTGEEHLIAKFQEKSIRCDRKTKECTEVEISEEEYDD
jgi:hypothetical protein